MEITKLSARGQVVLPQGIRRGVEVGTLFAVGREKDVIVLKRLKPFSAQERQEMLELQRIWRDIDAGKCGPFTAEALFKKLREW